MPTTGRRGEILWSVAVLLLPAVVFWWLLPVVGTVTLGNDYVIWSHRYHLEVMFPVWKGTFPLFLPGFCGGQTGSAVTLGQHHHPIAWLCSFMPGYWHGHALTWHTVFRLATLGLAHLCIFRLFRALRQPAAWAFVLSTALAYNLRMLDMFRYGASMEAHTGSLFLWAALGWVWLRPASRRLPLLLPLALWWLLCSGHPPMVWWALLGTAIFVLAFPWVAHACGVGPEPDLRSARRYLGRVAAWASLGIGLALSYALPFYFDFMSTNFGRVDQGYDWAQSNNDTLAGTFSSFFEPLAADVHGAFGGSALFLLAALVPVLALARVRLPRVVWFLWGAGLLAFLHMQGPRTPVHFLAWSYLPMASATRIAGRASQLLPICLVLLLLVASVGLASWPRAGWRRWIRPELLLALPALACWRVYLDSREPFFDWGTPMHFRKVPAQVTSGLLVLGVVVLVLVAFFLASRRHRVLGWLLSVAVVGQLGLALAWGTWVDARTPTATFAEMDGKVQADIRTAFDNPGDGFCSRQVEEYRAAGGKVPDDLAWLCFSPRNVEASEQPLREWYGPGRAWNRCTVEGGAPLVAQGDGVGPPSGRVVLERGSSNRLVFDIETRRPAWLVTALPRSEGWQARVDGRPVVTHRSDALFTAVAVPQGQSVVDLRYWSWAAFLGALAMALSSMVLVVLAARRCFEGRRRVITVAIGVGGCVVLFGLWWASLHHGPSYGTHYEYGFGWQEGGSSPAD